MAGEKGMIGTCSKLRRFHADIGHHDYDGIDFSAAPIADLALDRPGDIALIRHLGVRGKDLVASHSRHDDVAALLVNLTSIGRCRGRVAGVPIDRALRRGHVGFVPPGCDVDIEYPAAHRCLLLYMAAPRLAAVLAELGVGELAPIHSEDDARLAQLVMMIDQEMRAPGFASDMIVDGLMRAIMTGLAAHGHAPASDVARLHLSPVKHKRVTDFVEANLDQAIGLDDLANVAGLSVFHFSRTFKLATGESPYHFLGSRRLARAQQLLSESDVPLAELALACGFASQSHFTAAFTKSIGTSPGRYRRERRSARHIGGAIGR